MSQASISERAAGQLQLSGVLDYSTGPLLSEKGARLIAASSAKSMALDLSLIHI